MYHDRLLVYRKRTIRRQGDPVVAFESKGLRGNKDDVGAFVAALHFVVAFRGGSGGANVVGGGSGVLRAPASAGREEEGGGFVGAAADVAGADYTVAVGDGEVEQADGAVFRAVLFGDIGDELVDALDGL